MPKKYRPYEPEQQYLMPPNLEEWLPEDHLARFLRDVFEAVDLSEIYEEYEKSDRGYPPYEPGMMTRVLVYGYCVGTASSRKIQRKLVEDVAFRYLAAGNQPDFRTISDFRKRHLEALKRLFLQVLQLCQEAGLVKLGHVALDATKVKANASKHKAMSYERMVKAEEQLKREIEDLLERAKRVDDEEDRKYGKDRRGDELPEELARREKRVRKIQEAKEALEAKGRQEAQQKREERERKEQQARQEGRKVSGYPPKIDPTPKPKAQRNFTDPESGIQKGADGFIQGYNAQAAVDAKAQVIVACDVSANSKDSVHLRAMTEAIRQNLKRLPKKMSADSNYYSEENVKMLQEAGIDPYLTVGRSKHGEKLPPPPRGRIPKDATVKDRMRRKLRTKKGKKIYSRRKAIVEPVFGQIKGRGFRQFLLRGRGKVQGEWGLICATHNLLKLYRGLGGRWSRN